MKGAMLPSAGQGQNSSHKPSLLLTPGMLVWKTENYIFLPWSWTLPSCHGNPESRRQCRPRVPSRPCEQFSLVGRRAPRARSRCSWYWWPAPPAGVATHLSQYCCTTHRWSKGPSWNTDGDRRWWNNKTFLRTDSTQVLLTGTPLNLKQLEK